MRKIDIFFRAYNRFKSTPFIYFVKWYKRRKLARKAWKEVLEAHRNQIKIYE